MTVEKLCLTVTDAHVTKCGLEPLQVILAARCASRGLIGVGMLVFGGKSLHSLLLDSVILLLGLGVFVLGVYLARQGKSSPKSR